MALRGTVSAMADGHRRDPRPTSPATTGSTAPGARGVGGSGAPAGADDATQVQRQQPRSGPRDPEPTRMLPTVDRPSAAQAPSGGPFETPPPARPRRRGSGGSAAGTALAGRPPRPARPARRRRLPLPAPVAQGRAGALAGVPDRGTPARVVEDRQGRLEPSGDRPAAQSGTTYLLVGSDSREGLTRKQELRYGVGKGEGRRTDTIMLLHTGSGPNLLMSIPRDSIVDIPGHGTTKINAAFAYGGPKLLDKTIEQNTGIRVDDYVEIGFSGFVDVVDAVGGIQICPKQPMKDRRANLDIKKGCQEVDGKVALGYARSRHTSGARRHRPRPAPARGGQRRRLRRRCRRGRSSTRCATSGWRWPARARCGRRGHRDDRDHALRLGDDPGRTARTGSPAASRSPTSRCTGTRAFQADVQADRGGPHRRHLQELCRQSGLRNR